MLENPVQEPKKEVENDKAKIDNNEEDNKKPTIEEFVVYFIR
jgi:hypothetical protein